MYIYVIFLIFTGTAAAVFGLFVLSRSQNRLNILYFFLTMAFSLTTFADAFLRVASGPNPAILWMIVLTLGWLVMAALFLHFAMVFSGRQVRYVSLVYLAGLAMFLICISSPHYLVGLRTTPFGLATIPGPIALASLLLRGIYFMAGIYLLYKVFLVADDHNKKQQAGYFIAFWVIPVMVEASHLFFGFPAVPLTLQTAGFAIGIMGIMIIRNTPVEDIARGEIAEVATEALYDSLFLTDMAGIINYANEAGCKLSGCRVDELLGRKLGDLTNQAKDRLTRKDGSQAAIKTESFPVRNDKGYIYLVRDYTEIVNNFQEIEKNKKEIAALAEKEGRVIRGVSELLGIREVEQVEQWWQQVKDTDAAPVLKNAYDLNFQYIRLLEQAEKTRTELEEKVRVVDRINKYFAGREEELKKLEAELKELSDG